MKIYDICHNIACYSLMTLGLIVFIPFFVPLYLLALILSPIIIFIALVADYTKGEFVEDLKNIYFDIPYDMIKSIFRNCF